MPSWLVLRMTNHVEPLQDSKALRQHLKILLIPVDVYVVVINMLLAMVIPMDYGQLHEPKTRAFKDGSDRSHSVPILDTSTSG